LPVLSAQRRKQGRHRSEEKKEKPIAERGNQLASRYCDRGRDSSDAKKRRDPAAGVKNEGREPLIAPEHHRVVPLSPSLLVKKGLFPQRGGKRGKFLRKEDPRSAEPTLAAHEKRERTYLSSQEEAHLPRRNGERLSPTRNLAASSFIFSTRGGGKKKRKKKSSRQKKGRKVCRWKRRKRKVSSYATEVRT